MANEIEKGALYIVATPIGNLSDFSERAKKVLAEIDLIAAEDTRVTGLLLSHFGLHKSIVNYFEHNQKAAGERLLRELADGKSVALVTDAGTPAISDPGTALCASCREAGIKVIPIPGPSAVITALSASGFDSRRFLFEGFLPQDSEKKEVLESLLHEKRTAVFYEAPHRLKKTLAELYEALGERRLCLCRELTKINEEFVVSTLSEAIRACEDKEPRGEYVLVLEGCRKDDGDFFAAMDIPAHVEFYRQQGLSKMDAMKAVAKDRHLPKSAVYKEML